MTEHSTRWSDPEHDLAGDFRRAAGLDHPPCNCPTCRRIDRAAQREDYTMSTLRVSIVVEQLDSAGVSRRLVGGTIDHPTRGDNPSFLPEEMVRALRRTAADLAGEIASGDPRSGAYL